MFKKYLSLFLLLFLFHSYAQPNHRSPKDSLLILLKDSISDIEKANIYLRLSYYNTVMERENWKFWIEKATKIAVTTKSEHLNGRIQTIYMARYVNKITPDKLDSLTGILQERYRESNSAMSKGIFFLASGNRDVLKQKFKSAENYFVEALEIFKSLKLPLFEHITYEFLGGLWAYRTNNAKALHYFFKNYYYFHKSGNRLAKALTAYNIGIAYANNQQYAKGLLYMKKFWKIFANEDGSMSQLHASLSMAYCYIELRQFDIAEEQLIKTKELLSLSGDNETFTLYFKLTKSFLRLREKKYVECLDHINEIYPTVQKSSEMHPRIFPILLNNKFIAQFSLKDYQGAKASITELFALNPSYILPQQLKDAHEILYKIDSAKGSFKTAIEHYKIFAELADSISEINDDKVISKLQLDYDLKAKDYEIARLKITGKEQELQNTRKEATLYIVGLLLFIFLAATFLLYRYNRIKIKANKALLAKEMVLEKALNDKELLLKEIHHRVKNNLQFVNSMLSMQARPLRKGNPRLRDYLEKAESRIHSMAIIHQILYESDALDQIDFKQYLHKLIEAIKKSYPEKAIIYHLRLKEIFLDLNTALSLGLIAHEVILNALKHAFSEKEKGEIVVSLMALNGSVAFTVADNGKGIGETKKPNSTFGMDLITILSEQLNARVFKTNAAGHTFKLIFNLRHPQY